MTGSSGNDRLDGGAGSDTVYYTHSPRSVAVNLAAGTGRGWGADTLVSLERVDGSPYADVLTGNSAVNRLDGGLGGDRLYGREGRDRLLGGAGRDRLDGGPGRDRLNGGPGIDVCVNGELVSRCP
ncbi:MAG: calcium-binding protein, partial [Gaiellaceae bacterium]